MGASLSGSATHRLCPGIISFTAPPQSAVRDALHKAGTSKSHNKWLCVTRCNPASLQCRCSAATATEKVGLKGSRRFTTDCDHSTIQSNPLPCTLVGKGEKPVWSDAFTDGVSCTLCFFAIDFIVVVFFSVADFGLRTDMIRDAPIQIPPLSIGTDSRVEYSTHTCIICVQYHDTDTSCIRMHMTMLLHLYLYCSKTYDSQEGSNNMKYQYQ